LPKFGNVSARILLGKLIAIHIPGVMRCPFGNGRHLWLTRRLFQEVLASADRVMTYFSLPMIPPSEEIIYHFSEFTGAPKKQNLRPSGSFTTWPACVCGMSPRRT
jgi:hypothetical protein